MRDHLTKRIVPLILTFTASALFTTTLQSCADREFKPVGESEYISKRNLSGSGSAACSGRSRGETLTEHKETRPPGAMTPYRITFQPKALYTDAARANGVQGAVRLKITLLANGNIGAVTSVTRLPDGLTEQAIAAAHQIRFEPKRINGVPVSVVITREYTFTIY